MSKQDHQSALKQRLGQRLTTRQIQLMQMIALPCTDLERRVKEELEENPALEEGKEITDDTADDNSDTDITEDEMVLGDYADEDDIPDYKLRQIESNKTPGVEIPFADNHSLQESLLQQLLLTNLTEEERAIGEFVIGSLDEDGFLRRSRTGLMDDMAIYRGIETDEETIEKVEEVIKRLDPPGVGARSLREGLSIQLHARKETPNVALAKQIIDDPKYFEYFTTKAFDKLRTALGESDEHIREAIHTITRLNPSPGLDYSSRLEQTLQTVIPDFYIEVRDGDPIVSLNSADMPDVRVNQEFAESMQEYNKDLRKVPENQRDTARFIRQKIDDARWFVEMIKQRNHTLMETMSAIVSKQRDYFITGDIHLLKPMILKDIANMTGYDVSTISRVTSTKHVQTDFGIFPLKYFFSEGTVTDQGEEISTHRVKDILQKMIDAEDKQDPLTDEALSELLKEQGLNVARRTIAKYRDQLNIPIARLRKEL